MTEVASRYGPFQVIGKVGSGATGHVYRARDPRLNRDVAIKVLAQAGTDPARHRRLTDEAQAASALNHANIVTVFDVGVQDDVPFIVSELVDGASLRSLLGRAPLPIRDVLDLSVQMAEGLAAAHQAGIVHRDFKPENVMVTHEGRIKILDFGLAVVGAQGDASDIDATLTQAVTIQGTVPYMSPEQARGATIDYRTDQFSLGLTIYEMLAGRRAFQAETAAQTLAAILEDEPEPLAKLNARVPPPLRWTVERCLAKDPRQRYESTADLARELRTLRDRFTELGGLADTSQPARFRRRRGIAMAAGLAGVSILAAALARLQPSEPSLEQYRLTPIATDAGYEGSPAWSPDGKTLAYVATVDGIQQVFTKALGSPFPFQVTHARFDCLQPFWASDTRLYFVSLFQDRLGLYSISTSGGDPDPVLGEVSQAAISPDGETLALWRGEGNDYAGVFGLWLSSPPGSTPIRYTREPFGSKKFIEGSVHFSPDGTKIAVHGVSLVGRLIHNAIWIVPTNGAPPYEVTKPEATPHLIGGFSWMPDSRHIVGAFIAPRPGQHLWLMDLDRPDARLILPSAGIESDPAASPTGIAMSVQQANSDLYRLSLADPTPRMMLGSARNELDPASSRAAMKMALTTDQSGSEEIWLTSQQGELQRVLVTAADFPPGGTQILRSAAFSPDGQRVAYHRGAPEGGRIWISPVASGPPVRLNEGEGEQDMPSWSPDGAWIAYAHDSAGSGGLWSLSKMRAGAKSPPVLLAQDIVPYSPVKWAPNNLWIAFNHQDGLALVTPDGQTTKLLGGPWIAFEWSEDGQRLYGIRRSDDFKHLTFTSIHIASGEEHVLRANIMLLPVSPQPVRGFARVTPDTFVTSIIHVSSDIWLLEGFKVPENPWGPLSRLFRRPTPAR
jgi:serine/threonine protein kinase/Tol biopolymer transport system component